MNFTILAASSAVIPPYATIDESVSLKDINNISFIYEKSEQSNQGDYNIYYYTHYVL